MKNCIYLTFITFFITTGLIRGQEEQYEKDIEIVYPPNSGVFNVVIDGGVDNTGKTDVTELLQSILEERPRTIQVVYFPNGTYLVTGQLRMKLDRSRSPSSHSHGPWLVGQSRKETIIRLKDGTWPEPLYILEPDINNNNQYPKKIDQQVVLNMGDCTNTTFNKIVRNMSINTGKNNAGAIGVMYNTSNSGFMGEVDIISEDGQGVAGLALAGVENGPGQIRNIHIRGFDVGLYNVTDYVIASSNIWIENPNKTGIINYGITAGENFTIEMKNEGPAIQNVHHGYFCLIGGELKGKSINQTAIGSSTDGLLYLKNIKTSGFSGVVEKGKPTIEEYYTGEPEGLFYNTGTALNLLIKPTPKLPDYEPDYSKWANPLDYGALGDGKTDDTEAVQKALSASGKTHIVFPYNKTFRVTNDLKLGKDIVRVVGTNGIITSSLDDKCRLLVEDGTSDIVIIEGLQMVPPIHVNTGRTVIISSSRPRYQILGSDKEIRGKQKRIGLILEGTGDVFINDTPDGLFVNNPKQNVWIRHFNNEWGINTPVVPVQVKAGKVWMLGWKTENLAQRVKLEKEGYLEITGFNNYRWGERWTDGNWPIFEIIDGNFSCNGIWQKGQQINYNIVWETREGITKKFTVDDNQGSRKCPIYTGYKL